jgi:hypothetical protein
MSFMVHKLYLSKTLLKVRLVLIEIDIPFVTFRMVWEGSVCHSGDHGEILAMLGPCSNVAVITLLGLMMVEAVSS